MPVTPFIVILLVDTSVGEEEDIAFSIESGGFGRPWRDLLSHSFTDKNKQLSPVLPSLPQNNSSVVKESFANNEKHT